MEPQDMSDAMERTLVTARLALEPLLASHARMLFSKLQDIRLYRYHAGEPPRSIDELERRYRTWSVRHSPDGSQRWLNYAVRSLGDGDYVGWVQATIDDGQATLGYDIFPPNWSRGYATESCRELVRFLRDDLGIARFAANADAENLASIRLLERLEFVRVSSGPSEDMPGRTDLRFERS
jgi:[ribosomal protein S5]-alanine N-acetyltransferase